jgi:protein TonB
MTPGDPQPDLYVIGVANNLPSISSGDKVTVTLLPGGETFQATAMNLSGASGVRALRLLQLKEPFPTAFAKSSGILVAGMKEPMVIKGSEKAVAALRQCVDDQLPNWGVDPKAYEALRTPPTYPADHLWFTYQDYPEEAQARGQSGDVIARLDVDASGRVKKCAVVVSSGSSSLDDATCSISLSRGKFSPAIGSDGQPVAAQRVIRVVFRMDS